MPSMDWVLLVHFIPTDEVAYSPVAHPPMKIEIEGRRERAIDRKSEFARGTDKVSREFGKIENSSHVQTAIGVLHKILVVRSRI
jgi:hypothetical protein